MSPTVPMRQVHLDFHTSEKIVPIAQEFNPEEFAATLSEAHVNSVTCFSKCHHGMIYHDTRFGAKHPGLSRNLLAEQIEACHKLGIRVPVYISVGWDELQASQHPEWVVSSPERIDDSALPTNPQWRNLCLNSPYADYVAAQTLEVLESFSVDGLFFDIVRQGECLCPCCKSGMLSAGLCPENEEDRRLYAQKSAEQFRLRMTETIRKVNNTCLIFYNQGHISPNIRRVYRCYTHLEVESLPGGAWGYSHFPVVVRYARNLGLPVVGMTGKFHKSWADFGGFKNRAALEYECFRALAEGAGCSIGDQLHPTGKLDSATYRLVSAVYRSVEEKEPWCTMAEPVTEIGVFTPEAIGKATGRVDSSVAGATKMLIEAHHQFDVVDATCDWARYRVLILPDKITLDKSLKARVSEYLHNGGSIILSHLSGTDRETEKEFVLDEMPARLLGKARYSPDYVMPKEALASGIQLSPHVMYERSLEVEPGADAEVLADTWWPYFNRTQAHFCSHAHTPPERQGDFPAVVQRERVIYFSHPIFSMFMRHGVRAYKQLVLNALARLLPDPLIRADAPTTAQITLMRQAGKQRYILHILHYIPEHRYEEVHTIEDIIPLKDIQISVRIPRPKVAHLVPSQSPLDFGIQDGRVVITIPEVRGHAMVVFEN